MGQTGTEFVPPHVPLLELKARLKVHRSKSRVLLRDEVEEAEGLGLELEEPDVRSSLAAAATFSIRSISVGERGLKALGGRSFLYRKYRA